VAIPPGLFFVKIAVLISFSVETYYCII